MTSLIKAVEGEIVNPISEREVPRKNCPFYGFHMAMGMMMDSSGNQCAPTGEYKPCMMEMAGEDPDWNTCPYVNTEEFREKLETYTDAIKVFPEEFGKKGLSLRKWMAYIESKRVRKS